MAYAPIPVKGHIRQNIIQRTLSFYLNVVEKVYPFTSFTSLATHINYCVLALSKIEFCPVLDRVTRCSPIT